MNKRYGKDYEVAQKALKTMPAVRQDKVGAIKKAIEDGTYCVTPEMVAEKIISGNRN